MVFIANKKPIIELMRVPKEDDIAWKNEKEKSRGEGK